MGFKDWLLGNLHWFTGFLPIEDQYSHARRTMEQVFSRYDQDARTTLFYTTGHSLGGGLSQHALYSFPQRVQQAVAFDPSSVTGFVEQSEDNKTSACECRPTLSGEPRIYRVYDAYEILANLRIFHKVFFTPERHIQEVRFPNAASHSIVGLAQYLIKNSVTPTNEPWYAGKGKFSLHETCTAAFARKQRESCEVKVPKDQPNKCPQ
jgi:pimeloyl-ACP methyl ester carboxylesterase